MFKFLIFATLLITPYAHARPQARAPRLDGRIVGGTPADISEAPYTVALLLNWWDIGYFFHVCGGSIITDSVVVTAAHCRDDTTVSQWKVRAGSTLTGSGGQVQTLLRIVKHPRYYSKEFDIALFFLTDPLTIDGITTALVPLPAQDQLIVDGSSAFVTGWGATQEAGGSSTSLMKVTIPTVNQDVCNDAYTDFGGVSERMMCAGNFESGGQDACQGDSGGPLTIDGVLIGITSWGNGCGKPGYPGVWTRVPSYRHWIDTELKHRMIIL